MKVVVKVESNKTKNKSHVELTMAHISHKLIKTDYKVGGIA